MIVEETSILGTSPSDEVNPSYKLHYRMSPTYRTSQMRRRRITPTGRIDEIFLLPHIRNPLLSVSICHNTARTPSRNLCSGPTRILRIEPRNRRLCT